MFSKYLFTKFRIFPKLFNYHETVKVQHDVLELIRKNVEEHEETIDHNEPRDFTDKVKTFNRFMHSNDEISKCYLIHFQTLTEIDKTSDPSSSFHGESGRSRSSSKQSDQSSKMLSIVVLSG